jgi:hypothetical protein
MWLLGLLLIAISVLTISIAGAAPDDQRNFG